MPKCPICGTKVANNKLLCRKDLRNSLKMCIFATPFNIKGRKLGIMEIKGK